MNSIAKIPEKILDQIDREQIYAEFRERLSRLGNLKHARNEHEQRNWLLRWWYQGEMEQAQLDAQLLQADFAESLAKLMAINLVQSQQLANQQDVISLQQERLEQQNEKLRQQTELLYNQQNELKKQGDNLEGLVRDFFELKGLTEGEARKLIAIANEVKSTKNDMYEHFDTCVHDLRSGYTAFKVEVGDAVAAEIAEQREALSAAESNFTAQYVGHEARFSKHVSAVETKNHAIQIKLNEHLSAIASIDEKILKISGMHGKVQQQVDEMCARAVAVEQATDAQFRLTMQRFWWTLSVGASGLIIAVGDLIARHWLIG